MVRLMSCPPYVVVKIERIQEYRQTDRQSVMQADRQQK